MKKMMRWYYKKYLLIVFFAVIIGCIYMVRENPTWYVDVPWDFAGMSKEELVRICQAEMEWLSYGFLQCYREILFNVAWGAVLFRKAFHYWVKKEQSGRCYMASLPFRKMDFWRVEFVTDLCTVTLIFVLCSVVTRLWYDGVVQAFPEGYFEITGQLIRFTIIMLCYFWFFLGIYYLLESLFVNGLLKALGPILILGFSGIVLGNMNWTAKKNTMIESCYQFVTLHHIFEDSWKDTYEKMYQFVMSEAVVMDCCLYVIIGGVAFGCSYLLTRRQEESQQMFYHKGTKFVLAGLSVVVMIVNAWQIVN